MSDSLKRRVRALEGNVADEITVFIRSFKSTRPVTACHIGDRRCLRRPGEDLPTFKRRAATELRAGAAGLIVISTNGDLDA